MSYSFPSAEVNRLSFLEAPELLFTAKHAMQKSPKCFAEKYDLYVERSFEDGLGYYDFVGFRKGEYSFGLRKLDGNPKKNMTFISVLGAPDEEKRYLISMALGVHIEEIFEFNDEY